MDIPVIPKPTGDPIAGVRIRQNATGGRVARTPNNPMTASETNATVRPRIAVAARYLFTIMQFGLQS
jgi:hypothetical protein